jgi:hypothetical protein
MGTRRGLSTRKIAIFAIFSLACSSAASLSPESLRKRPGFAWKTGHSASFTYFFEASSSAERDIEKIKRGAEESRAHVLKLLGETSGSAPPVSVFIVETNQRMKDLGGNPGNAWSTDKLIAFVYGDRVKADGAASMGIAAFGLAQRRSRRLLGRQLVGTSSARAREIDGGPGRAVPHRDVSEKRLA